MKKVILLFVLFGIGSLSAQKVAYVEEIKILKSVGNYESDLRAIEELKNRYNEEVNKSNKELDEKIMKLISAYKFQQNESLEAIKSKLKPADLKKLDEYIKENEAIQEKSKSYQEELKKTYDEKIQPSLDKVNKSLEEYAKKNKIAIIYKLENISPALAFIDKSLNVTDEVIKSIK